jgi:hypothetical protein
MRSIIFRPMHACLAVLGCASLLAACTPPDKPEEERRPEPRSQADPARVPQSAIVQTAEAYKDRARAAQDQQADAADRQREAIDAATR